MSHETFPDPLEMPLSAHVHSGDDLLRAACAKLDIPHESSRIELDRDLVVSIDCEPCGTSRTVMRPLQEVGHREANCEGCGQVARPRIEHTVDVGSDLAQAKLVDLGIPPYDIVRVVSGVEQHVVLLADDRRTTMASPVTEERDANSGTQQDANSE